MYAASAGALEKLMIGSASLLLSKGLTQGSIVVQLCNSSSVKLMNKSFMLVYPIKLSH
jgi:hypothetical protein